MVRSGGSGRETKASRENKRRRVAAWVPLLFTVVAVIPTLAVAELGETILNPVVVPELPVEVETELGPAGSLKQAPLWKEMASMLEDPYAPASRRQSFIYRNADGRPCAPGSEGCAKVPMPPLNVYDLDESVLTAEPLRLRTADGEISWDQPGPLFDPDEPVATENGAPTELRTIIGELFVRIDPDSEPSCPGPAGCLVVDNPSGDARIIDGVLHELDLCTPSGDADKLYDAMPYLNAYATHTDQRVLEDPHTAVGGRWEEMGRLQLEYLVTNGLQPSHNLLDIGCGTLRGGRHFIRYLDVGRYTGFDISTRALAYANDLVQQEGLTKKRPRLLLDEDKWLRFSPFDGDNFDFLLAQSVFTHLPSDVIEGAFSSLHRVTHERSMFFFTFWAGDAPNRHGLKDFTYPPFFFATLAERNGFSFDIRDDFAHPKGQTMAVVSRRSPPG